MPNIPGSSSGGTAIHKPSNSLTSSEQKLLDEIRIWQRKSHLLKLEADKGKASLINAVNSAIADREDAKKNEPSRLDLELIENERKRKEEEEEKRQAAIRLAELQNVARDAKADRQKKMQAFFDKSYQPKAATLDESGSTTPPLPPAPDFSGSSAVGSTSPTLPPPPTDIKLEASPSAAETGAAVGNAAGRIKKRVIGDAVPIIPLTAGTSSQAPPPVPQGPPEVIEENQVSRGVWDSAKDPVNRSYLLPAFSLQDGPNTIRIKLSVPFSSKMWSLNVSPEHDFYGRNILFHYNPRVVAKGGEVVLNDRLGTWGDYTKRRIDQQNDRIVRDAEIRIIIGEEGFYLFVGNNRSSSSDDLGRLDTFFPHRRDIRDFIGQNLKIWFTYRDDNGLSHSVVVKKVYWEKTQLNHFYATQDGAVRGIVSSRLADRVPRSVSSPMPPRTVLLSGLPVLEDLKNLQGIESNLFIALDDNPESKDKIVEAIAMIPGTEYAFVRLKSEEFVQQIIDELDELELTSSNQVHVIRARPMMESGVLDVEGRVRSLHQVVSSSSAGTIVEEVYDELPPSKRSKYEVADDEIEDHHHIIEEESGTPDMPPPPDLPEVPIEVAGDEESRTPPLMPPEESAQPQPQEEDEYEDLY